MPMRYFCDADFVLCAIGLIASLAAVEFELLPSDAYPTIEKRPLKSTLKKSKAMTALNSDRPVWENGLDDYLSE